MAAPRNPEPRSISWKLQLVAETARAVARLPADDLREALGQITQAARLVSGADEGIVFLRDVATSKLYVAAQAGHDRVVQETIHVLVGDDAFSRFSFSQARSIETLKAAEIERSRVAGVLLSIPLRSWDRQLGLLSLRGFEIKYSRDDQQLLDLLAIQAAAVIERAWPRSDLAEPRYLEEKIDRLYDELQDLVARSVKEPTLRSEIAERRRQLQALQEEEAEIADRRAQDRLHLKPGEGYRALGRAKELLR